ncbi:VOC family protein [Micromonosporaceae bacterium DT55]|uniref:VOC family protein n=1 Tax=Melissospora conviva TaxID=3388432 RepID=UPI003C20B950
MAHDFQLTVDSAQPHDQADWWAETLGWQVEPSDKAFIQRMVDEGQASPEDTTRHRGVLVWAAGAALRHPDNGRRILFQQVPEGKTVKNRLHLDIEVGAEQVESVAAELTRRGATFLHNGRQGPFSWITMADPEGNEFCIC